MALKLRRVGSAELHRLDAVARHLKLRCRADDDEFLDAVTAAVIRRIKPIIQRAAPKNGEELVAAVAAHLNVHFEPVRSQSDIDRIRDHYVKKERQLGFAQLGEELADRRIDALLFQL